jgi:hypothetical protein
MKKYIITSLLLIFAVSFWNCEKDDICAETTPTTPKVIIEFYDFNTQTLKNVTNLRIEENGTDVGVVFNESLEDTNPAKFLTNENKISIPLKTFEDSSQFEFILNYEDTSQIIDILTFNYERNDVYISRACGYKTLFRLNTPNGITTSSNNWIQNIEIVQTSINNENETHVKIYF